ncbi:MAG: family 78 glycoside hydrolase catalytic domain [Clostridia bacterium]|nr:family 78 glycoside hydrolase catalytic domain [Clostridia bacterium]
MKNNIFKYGEWICPVEFLDEQPINLLSKEKCAIKPELPEKFKNVHMLTKKTFSLAEKVGSYSIRITADDYYKLYINGQFVAQGVAQGYHFCYYWNEIDITDFLKAGKNEIYVDVYYQGLVNRVYNSADRRMGLVAEIYNNDACILATDSSWQYTLSGAYTISHIIGYDTAFAENFDSRWTPAAWHNACEKKVDYTFSDESVKTLQVYPINPVLTKELENGAIFYDFGSEITATLRITARGKSGDMVRILCGEELEDTPLKVRYNMRANCLYDERWTLADGESTLAQYEYKAFRYVTLVPDRDVEITSICAMVQHYPFDDDYCTLETDNKVLKSVWDVCKNGIKYGAGEVFVDCPSREKGQYAGDLTISSASHVIVTGDYSLFKKAVDNQMQSAAACRGLLAVTPGNYMQEIADYSLQFPILALRHYNHFKDTEYLKKCYDVCDGIIEHFSRFQNADGLLETVDDKWNLVDWPDNLRDGYDFKLEKPLEPGVHNVINAFYIGCIMQTEQIADILGIARENKSRELIAAYNTAFFNKETGLYTDRPYGAHSSLHSNVVPAFYGITTADQNDKIAEFIMQKGLCCGVYFAYFVLKSLCKMGKYHDAYSLIINESEHSWYNMVREGATTCFEAWGKDQKWNTSLCHPWASGPISVLAEDILPNMPEVGRLIYKNK